MKTLKLIVLAAFAFLFSQCKTTSPTAPSAPAPSLLEASNIQTMTRNNFFKFADSTKGDPSKAIILTANWVRTQPNVQAVDVLDSTYINIDFKSGLTTTFFFDRIGADSISISRGGHGKKTSTLSLPRNGILSKNTIDNHNVLFYGASNNEFYSSDQLLRILDKLDSSPVPLKTTMMSDAECTPQVVETFGNYGLVFIDSHGFPDGYLTGTQLVFVGIPKSEDDLKSKIIHQTNADTYNKLLTGEIKIAAEVRVNTIIPEWQKHPAYLDSTITLRLMTTTKYISELPSMPNTVIFGNTCYSGANQITESWFTTPIQTAWQNKNVISYYGYTTADGLSAPVNNLFARIMLDTFIQHLTYKRDSTGDANLQKDGNEYTDPYQKDQKVKLFFRHFGADDYSYIFCRDTMIDPRDGQVYPTVCIGKQIWMAKDLNYNSIGSMCYDSVNSSCDVYGRLYTWTGLMQGAASSNANPSGVQGVCPKGWHVPSSSEWQQMDGTLAHGGDLKDTTLWESPNAGATNVTGFTALPGGYRLGFFANVGKSIMFGSSTITSNYEQWFGLNYFDGSLAPTVGGQPGDNSGSYCRCVKDP